MGSLSDGRKPAALRVLVAVIGGAAYGAFVGYTRKSGIDGVSAGGVAFLCLLALQSQFLRPSKGAPKPEPRPETPAALPAPTPLLALEKPADVPAAPAAAPPVAESRDDATSIDRGIKELKEQGAFDKAEGDEPTDGQKPLFRNLYRQPTRAPVEALTPRQLLELKLPYQAVLNAAVNFERQIRQKADLPAGRTMPLTELFEQPRFALPKEKLQQLDTLRRIRNSILQGQESYVDPLEAEELVGAFERAVAWFVPGKGP